MHIAEIIRLYIMTQQAIWDRQILKNTGRPMEDLLIGDPIPHPTIPGIFEQKYTVPGYDGIIKKGAPKGKFLGYKNIKEPKTYYDPTQITDTEMVQAAKDAMRNGTLEGSDSRKVVGTTLLKGEEIKFVAYIKDGEFSTIYPTLRKEKTKKKGKEGKE